MILALSLMCGRIFSPIKMVHIQGRGGGSKNRRNFSDARTQIVYENLDYISIFETTHCEQALRMTILESYILYCPLSSCLEHSR